MGNGRFACREVQDLAATAREDVSKIVDAGALPAWKGVASLGSDGAFPNNIERDLHRWLGRVRKYSMGFDLQLYNLPLHLYKVSEPDEEEVVLWPVFQPHEIFHALWQVGGATWQGAILGPNGEHGVNEFWEHQKHLPWVRAHPAARDPDKLRFTVPTDLHGDDVQCRNQDMRCEGKLLILQFGSTLSEAPTFNNRFLITVLPCHRVVPGKTLEEVVTYLTYT